MSYQPMTPIAPLSVFISYACSDGGDYAVWLRNKLQREHPDIELWQDIISELAGRDWWLQIIDALNRTAYMSLVATPDADIDADLVTMIRSLKYVSQ